MEILKIAEPRRNLLSYKIKIDFDNSSLNKIKMSQDKEKRYVFLSPNKDDKDKINDETDTYAKYIIHLNNTLQETHKADSAKIQQLEYKVENLEGEQDSWDSKRSYLKGLLKNFHEVSKWDKTIVTVQNNMLNVWKKKIYDYKYRAWFHLKLFYSFLALTLALVWEFRPTHSFLDMLSLVIIVVSFQYSMFLNLELPNFKEENKKINKLQKDKLEVATAQDYIHEFIEAQ